MAKSNDNFTFAVIAIGAVIYFFFAPTKESWAPLDLETWKTSAAYLDESTVRWSGEVVKFSTKMVNKVGGPISIDALMPDQRQPVGIKTDWSLDCKQKMATILKSYVFATDGEYAQMGESQGKSTDSLVLDGSKPDHGKWLSVCETQRPGLNPFKREFVWELIKSQRSEKTISLTDWVDNRRTGKGAATWSDGSRYAGDFVSGKKSGNGILWFPGGDKYEGTFVNDVMSGKGTYTWRNGNVYSGDWVNGERSGNGTEIFPNGDRYDGPYIKGKMSGKGLYTYANGGQQWFYDGHP